MLQQEHAAELAEALAALPMQVVYEPDGLSAEKRLPELPGLGGREPRQCEHLHNLIRKLRLFGRKRRRLVPAQTSANVLVYPGRGACELVSEFMQLAHLLEQRLELRLVDRHNSPKGTFLDQPYPLPPLVLAKKHPPKLGQTTGRVIERSKISSRSGTVSASTFVSRS